MPNQIHLLKRNSTYYYRRRIPFDLLDHYSPKTVIVFSLKTKDPKEAERLARVESVKLDQEFEKVRFNLTASPVDSISQEDIKKLSDAWIAHVLEEDEEARIEGLSESEYQNLTESFDIVEIGSKAAFARGDYHIVDFEMIDFCESMGFKIVKDSNAYNQLAYAFLRATIEANEKLKLRHQGEIVETPKAPRISPSALPSVNPMDSLEKLRDYWLSQSNKSRTAEAEANTMIRKFRKYVGDLKPSEIRKAHVVELKDKMLEAGSSPATINKGRGILAAIFSCAEKNVKIESNPFLGMEKLKVPRKEVDSPYTIQELNTIFNSPVFKEGYRPKQGKGEAAFWMPLLGLYTGCRLNEVAQIFLEDIGEEDDIPYIIIRPDDATGRTIKDNKRRIPIHLDLVRIGFLEYIEQMRKENQTQLFPMLKITRTGGKLADKWRGWWSSYVRTELGIKRVPAPFHGLRHSFTEFGRRCGMEYEARMRIEGHALNTVGDKQYGNVLFPLEPLYEELKKLRYKGLSIEHLLNKSEKKNG